MAADQESRADRVEEAPNRHFGILKRALLLTISSANKGILPARTGAAVWLAKAVIK